MQLEMMPLLGVAVPDLPKAIEKFSALFDLEFKIFTANVDYSLSDFAPEANLNDQTDSSPALPPQVSIAVDTKDTFELLELDPSAEGFRNVHFRVSDMDQAVAHFRAKGMTPIKDLKAGNAREVIFDASELNGIRLCLLQFEGDSFAAALAGSPRPEQH